MSLTDILRKLIPEHPTFLYISGSTYVFYALNLRAFTHEPNKWKPQAPTKSSRFYAEVCTTVLYGNQIIAKLGPYEQVQS